ncbi:relaxase/mobilization nuclease domain-containing protein [Sphingomonas sp. XXL09]|uniref:relaxase/mobilization nuclease domain-containing protein n=1 Tax=Sphingomonas sp. XXL09 TaxID=3457787 RepID=UPI00406BA353
MSLNLSAGTLDTMAGIFSPARKHRPGSGGGSASSQGQGAALLGFAVASMFPKSASNASAYRASAAVKRAFGGGSQTAVSGRAIAAMDRTARRVPEVMVRITGRQHGRGHVLANFAYISRLGHGLGKELALETSDGEIIRDGREMQELAQEWQEWEMGDDARRKGATSISMILSMPSGTDPERLKAAALDFAREEFANRSWVAALHVDRDHPHVHLTFARRDHDGRRFHPNRDDLFRYRQRFAQKLRDRGIEANATPAKARGIDATHEPIAARKVRATGAVPRIDRSRQLREAIHRNAAASDRAQIILAARHAAVRDAYLRSIAELKATPSIVNQTVARSLETFVEALPGPVPNSVTAARDLSMKARPAERSNGEVGHMPGAEIDALAAAMARSEAMRARIQARRANADAGPERSRDGVDPPTTKTGVGPGNPVADPTPRAGEHDGIEAVMRQVRERERTPIVRHRDRDRERDRGGPGR